MTLFICGSLSSAGSYHLHSMTVGVATRMIDTRTANMFVAVAFTRTTMFDEQVRACLYTGEHV